MLHSGRILKQMQLKEVEEFLDTVRRFLKERGYTEVVTPYLLNFPNLDSNIYPIECSVSKLSVKGLKKYLHTSPEYSMKKLIAKYGIDIFQICHVFRNYEEGKFHDNEFLMLEYYKIGKDYTYLMEEMEELLKTLFGEKITYLGREIPTKVKRIELKEAFKQYLGLDIEPLTEESLKNQLTERGIYFEKNEDLETLFFRAYTELERFLGFDFPTIVYGFPEPFGALAKCKNGWCERFELYIFGLEIANAYTELTDYKEVKRKLIKEAENLNLPVDDEFIEIHKRLPEKLTGISVGLDRLLAIKLNLENIHELYYRKLWFV
jgi:lysyl-tRNA synthetase class 2